MVYRRYYTIISTLFTMARDKTAAVVGGYGGMGKIFAALLAQEGFNVTISGPSETKGGKVAGELEVTYERDNINAVSHADVTIISVPIDKTVSVIAEVGPALKKGSLLMDVTSIKQLPCKTMEEHCPKGVEILGTHPIFGPRVNKVDGQVFVLTPIREGKWSRLFIDILKKHKVRVHATSPETHDEVMAVVQGLTHFTYISLAKTLHELSFDIKDSRNYSSPVYEMMLDMVGRIIGQDPHLYAEIQMRNPKIPRVHKAFLKASKTLSEIVGKGDEKAFVSFMVEAAKHFDDVERAMGRSDKAIESLVAELKLIKGSVGRELLLEHIYSGKKHLGVVEDVSPDEVLLLEGGGKKNLKLSNIRVLGGGEKKSFKIEKFGAVARDFSILIDSPADEDFISKLLMQYDDRIISVNVKDVYEGKQLPEGKKSVCFGIEIINEDAKDADAGVSDFFEKLGGVRR